VFCDSPGKWSATNEEALGMNVNACTWQRTLIMQRSLKVQANARDFLMTAIKE